MLGRRAAQTHILSGVAGRLHLAKWVAGGERELGLPLVRRWSSAENTGILGTKQPRKNFLPIKKMMGLSESWSKMAPPVATEDSNNSAAELSGMLTLVVLASNLNFPSCARIDPWV